MVKREPLCRSCRVSSVCKLTPRSSVACDGYDQKGRDRKASGLRVSEDRWGR